MVGYTGNNWQDIFFIQRQQLPSSDHVYWVLYYFMEVMEEIFCSYHMGMRVKTCMREAWVYGMIENTVHDKYEK